MKSVQIPYDLFVDLALYHLNGEDDLKRNPAGLGAED